jgi:hypothetical protein
MMSEIKQQAEILDYTTVKGLLGSLMMIVFPSLEETAIYVKIIGGLGGLVLLYFSIRVKYLEYKKLKNES